MSGEPSPLRAAFSGRCPRCGIGNIYRGLLRVAEQCPNCALDLRAEDAGDGPAVFVILILGAVIMIGVVTVELKFTPRLWVHFVLWPPLILGGAIWFLRVLKAALIALQYRHHLLSRG